MIYLSAFNTPTGLPYGSVNLQSGVAVDETPITCTACCTSFVVEFGTLSRLTGQFSVVCCVWCVCVCVCGVCVVCVCVCGVCMHARDVCISFYNPHYENCVCYTGDPLFEKTAMRAVNSILGEEKVPPDW